jgi:SAM-dependent methyltransferase
MTESPEHAHSSADATAAEWDERYGVEAQLFSGRVNFALVTEVSELEPGRALDVGCGEGADAVWLAGRGWEVTGLDVSGVALERAAQLARHADVQVNWVHAGLLDATLPAGGFDLVSVQYPALRSSPGHDAERALLDAVAPKGLLLVVFHAGFDGELARAHGIDPDDYVGLADLVAMLGTDWQVTIDENRLREVPAGPEGQHTHDVVLRAQRRN